MSTITLVSQEGNEFKVSRESARLSTLIKGMMKSIGLQEEERIELAVESNILPMVIEYCDYHKDLKLHVTEEDRYDNLSEKEKEYSTRRIDNILEWDKEFITRNVAFNDLTLFRLIKAAEYLHIQPLIALTLKSLACEFYGKTPEQLEKRFNTKLEFTEEEKEQIRKKNSKADIDHVDDDKKDEVYIYEDEKNINNNNNN